MYPLLGIVSFTKHIHLRPLQTMEAAWNISFTLKYA